MNGREQYFLSPFIILFLHHNLGSIFHFSDPSPFQISRRSWAGHPLAKDVLRMAVEANPRLQVTIPHEVDDVIVGEAL